MTAPEEPNRPGGNPALLVVDDNVRLAQTIVAYMEMEGFRAIHANSAEEALLAAGRSSFDLALVDINMPGMDGIEVCRRLREMLPGIRVVIVTGRDAEEDPKRAAAVGARQLLIKPVPLASLRDELLRILAT
jgi:DNA-binding response OmpR family regulator